MPRSRPTASSPAPIPRDLRRAHLPDGRRRIGPAPRGPRHAARRPRPAGHGLVAGRAAPRVALLAGPAEHGRSSARRWGRLVRRRARSPRPARSVAGGARHRDRRLRPAAAVALAGGHRVVVRPAAAAAIPRLHPQPDRELRGARWGAAGDERRQADLPPGLAGVPAGDDGRRAAPGLRDAMGRLPRSDPVGPAAHLGGAPAARVRSPERHVAGARHRGRSRRPQPRGPRHRPGRGCDRRHDGRQRLDARSPLPRAAAPRGRPARRDDRGLRAHPITAAALSMAAALVGKPVAGRRGVRAA